MKNWGMTASLLCLLGATRIFGHVEWPGKSRGSRRGPRLPWSEALGRRHYLGVLRVQVQYEKVAPGPGGVSSRGQQPIGCADGRRSYSVALDQTVSKTQF